MPLKLGLRGVSPSKTPRPEATESAWGRVVAIGVAVIFGLCIMARFIVILAG
jgi:hypothetical protein